VLVCGVVRHNAALSGSGAALGIAAGIFQPTLARSAFFRMERAPSANMSICEWLPPCVRSGAWDPERSFRRDQSVRSPCQPLAACLVHSGVLKYTARCDSFSAGALCHCNRAIAPPLRQSRTRNGSRYEHKTAKASGKRLPRAFQHAHVPFGFSGGLL